MSKWVWETDGGIYSGIACDPRSGQANPDDAIFYSHDRHVLTFGPNGSGKSMRLLYQNLMRLTGWSMLVIDPKGELAKLTGPARAARGKVLYLNPYGVNGLPSHGFNPIDSLDPSIDDFIDDAMGLAEAVIRIERESKEPHWSESAQDLLASLIMYAALQDDPARRSLAFIRQCLGQAMADFRQTMQAVQSFGIAHDWDELTVKASRFQDVSPDTRELTSIVSNAVTQTRWLDSRPMKADIRKGRIDFAGMKAEPTTIYLILPANRLVTHSTWLRLVITCCLQKLIRDAVPGEVPVMLICEEAAVLGHLPMIENTMALMRGYGVKLWSVWQDLSQLQAIYGNRWESFISNAGLIGAFAPQDTATADYLSKLSGQMTADTHGASSSLPLGDGQHSIGMSRNQFARPVMWPGELRGMGDGHMVVFSHRTPNMIRAFAPYPKLPA